MVEVWTGPTTEYHDFTGDNRHQQSGKRSECGDAGLRVSGWKGVVHLPRVHTEFVSDPMPHGIHLVHLWLSHVFFYNAR